MPSVATTIDVARPVEDVFAFLTDLDNAPSWTVDLIEVRADPPLARGVHGVDVRRLGRKIAELRWEVARWEPPRDVEFVYQDPFPMVATFALDPTPAGTRLTCTTVMHPTGWYRLLAPMIVREARRTDAQQFARAKAVLEGRQTGPPAAHGSE